ncbi:iron-sulfur cluster carrier protein ApbC [Chitinimonas arctica]|uniref:Iron-sulfur cluster carrier protein n=1 Tax=Chitinimonas arctica TaxID=2594795 RepID=A0A516SLA9_9NEIS|nr:iron-sulfur cluster carrier protein ApbC [Chitinimonas arctica]QDQ28936.1 iron-sulfur cluster carrier protein ApbC [Chitinimonas arctica]
MATLNELNTALAACVDRDTGRDYVAMKAVRDLSQDGELVSLTLALPYPAQSRHAEIGAQLEQALLALEGVSRVNVKVETRIEAHTVQRGLTPLPGVKNVIAIASGKGGVGKSTTAVNLALALSAEGARVGILDADIYGPSQPLMLGLQGQRPESPDGKSIIPLSAHGIQAMSIGFLIDAEQPMVWRGPMVTQALMQLLNDSRWDDLDYLLIDLPPGTGDIQLTLSQKVPLTGAVIVTTPQDIALLDARKGLKMFEKVGVPVTGVVENMAMHICSNCGHAEAIFGEGGGGRMAQEYGVELLGQLPLEMSIRLATDTGAPSVAAEPDGAVAALYKAIARKVAVKIGEKAKDFSAKLPKIVIQNT